MNHPLDIDAADVHKSMLVRPEIRFDNVKDNQLHNFHVHQTAFFVTKAYRRVAEGKVRFRAVILT